MAWSPPTHNAGIVWVSAPGDYATFNSNHTPDGTSVAELIALRFVTGIALGATIPSGVALTTEYSPKRLRATFVLAIYCGFSLGFVAAGGLAAWIIPLHGWRSLLWIGAIAPLTLAVFVFIFLPESLDFLVRTIVQTTRLCPHKSSLLSGGSRSAVPPMATDTRTSGIGSSVPFPDVGSSRPF